MGIMLAGVRTMGIPFASHLSEYLRTIVYRVPGLIVREDHLSPIVVQDTPNFKASIVTDPLSYLSEQDFSDQYNLDPNFPEVLQGKCGVDDKESDKRIFAVIQFKEDMQSFSAIEGQCIKIEHDGFEQRFIVDCDDAPTPVPSEREESVNSVLTATRTCLGVNGEFENVFDAPCYKTDDGECLYPLSVKISMANLTVLNPLTPEEAADRLEAVKVLAARIEEEIGDDNSGGQRGSGIIPKVFLSYSWDDAAHKEWVKELAARLRKDGIDVTFDQWEAMYGDQMPSLMEAAIRESQFVLIICTPRYKIRSDAREGGVGYEGDIMTAEIISSRNNRKFIPVLRRGTWQDASPSWLSGKYYCDLSSDPFPEERYRDLVLTLLGKPELPPPIGEPMSTFE